MKVQQQGEVRIERVEVLPEGLSAFGERTRDGRAWIISHSGVGTTMFLIATMSRYWSSRSRRPPEFGEGMKILYAIVKNPTEMRQDAAVPHETAPLAPGIYEMTISTEIDPFTAEARRVAD